MITTSHFLTLAGTSLATAAIVKILLGIWPRLPKARSALIVAESIVLVAATLAHQLKWSSLPQLIFNGFIMAACATQSLQHDRHIHVPPKNRRKQVRQ